MINNKLVKRTAIIMTAALMFTAGLCLTKSLHVSAKEATAKAYAEDYDDDNDFDIDDDNDIDNDQDFDVAYPEDEEDINVVYLEKTNNNETCSYTVKKMDTTMTAKSDVNVRKGPKTTYKVMGSLAKGEKVHVTGQVYKHGNKACWVQISTRKGTGYVCTDYLR